MYPRQRRAFREICEWFGGEGGTVCLIILILFIAQILPPLPVTRTDPTNFMQEMSLVKPLHDSDSEDDHDYVPTAEPGASYALPNAATVQQLHV